MQAVDIRAKLDPNLLVSARRGEKSIRNSFHTRRINQSRRWADAAENDEKETEADDNDDPDGSGDDADDDDEALCLEEGDAPSVDIGPRRRLPVLFFCPVADCKHRAFKKRSGLSLKKHIRTIHCDHVVERAFEAVYSAWLVAADPLAPLVPPDRPIRVKRGAMHLQARLVAGHQGM